MNNKFLSLALSFCVLLSPILKAESKINRLESEQVDKLRKGELIVLTQRKSGQRWPEVEIYSYLKAPAKEAFAIFSHFEHQKNYIPDLIKSSIEKGQSSTKINVAYELKLPWPLSNSKYTHAHRLAQKDNNEFHMSWEMVKSTSAKSVEGQVQILPTHEENFASLMIYRNQVRPKSTFARLFREAMVRDVEKSLKATVEEIHRVWKSEPKVLKESLDNLEKSLSKN